MKLPAGVCVDSLETSFQIVTNHDGRLKQWNSLPREAQNGLCDIYRNEADYQAKLKEICKLADAEAAKEEARMQKQKINERKAPLPEPETPGDPFGI